MLILLFKLYYQTIKVLSSFLILLFAMSVCAFNSLHNGEYSKLFIVAAFSTKSFSSKTYLLTLPDDKAEILAVCQSKSY